ncbi:MAG: hypothetical protein ABIA02_00250 [Candidatus Falkowbacteria bacterium]
MPRRKKVIKKSKKVGLKVRVVSQNAQKRITEDTEKISQKAQKKIENTEKKQKKEKKKEKPKEEKQKISKDPIQEEHDKKLLMFTATSIIMIVIIGVWIFNIKHVFKKIETKTIENKFITEDWDKMTEEFSKTLEKVREGIDELKDESAQEVEENNKQNADIIINIEDLKIKLEEIGTSATTSAN